MQEPFDSVKVITFYFNERVKNMSGVQRYLKASFFGLLPMLIVVAVGLHFLSNRFSGNAVGRVANKIESAARI